MIRGRAAVLGAVLWCVVVVAASSLVWVVISRAGAGVVPSAQPQVDVTGSLPVPARSHSGRPTPGVTLSTHPSRPSSPGGTPSGGPTGSPAVPPPSTSSTPSTPGPPAPERSSWSGAAGHVVAECRGSAGHFVAAYPNAGWRYLIGSRGPAVVKVRFVRVGEDGRSVTVQARCVSGVPHFALPAHESGDAARRQALGTHPATS